MLVNGMDKWAKEMIKISNKINKLEEELIAENIKLNGLKTKYEYDKSNLILKTDFKEKKITNSEGRNAFIKINNSLYALERRILGIENSILKLKNQIDSEKRVYSLNLKTFEANIKIRTAEGGHSCSCKI